MLYDYSNENDLSNKKNFFIKIIIYVSLLFAPVIFNDLTGYSITVARSDIGMIKLTAHGVFKTMY